MGQIVYFSTSSGNTRRFVEKLGLPAHRIPLSSRDAFLLAPEPYILIVPTYGGGHPVGAVPKAVIQFLNHEGNRERLRGVIAAGNTNFGTAYCLAGTIIAQKCKVPLLYRFEMLGTEEDVIKVRHGVQAFWKRQH
ncbi:class Ib ribonucleoside-diphosphate reductase assembly flavoprotein NrdI [Kerstersia similis]|uniref:class Ib ribonucleoside-diphosphate reductase assembly flavoprotein NrdI n=1 Tax=Kerstersia similis TaxID=206505 RepID=UPI0039EF1941